MNTFTYDSMGTRWGISLWENFPDSLKKEIFELSDEFDTTYSRFKPDSLVTKISKAAGTYEVPEDFLKMLLLYFDLYELSEKKLNPLIGFAISDLGYDENYSLREKEMVRKVPSLFETVSLTHEGHLHGVSVSEPVLFDFGALGKGYFVDKIANLLKEKGYGKFLVNGSGDIYYWGSDSAFFGLEDPENPKKLIGRLEISANPEQKFRAFCASGTNRRHWPGKKQTLNHELDAVTLEPADYILATWVQAETCALADALATCLFFVPPENFLSREASAKWDTNYQFEYLLMNKHREIKKSDGFKVELY